MPTFPADRTDRMWGPGDAHRAGVTGSAAADLLVPRCSVFDIGGLGALLFRDVALEAGAVKAMYGRGFVAGILAGFEETLEVLMASVDEDARRELRVLSGHFEHTRLQLDLDPDVEDDGENQPEEQYLRAR